MLLEPEQVTLFLVVVLINLSHLEDEGGGAVVDVADL